MDKEEIEYSIDFSITFDNEQSYNETMEMIKDIPNCKLAEPSKSLSPLVDKPKEDKGMTQFKDAVTDIPDVIYLWLGEPSDLEHADIKSFNQLDSEFVLWSKTRIDETDVKYIRANNDVTKNSNSGEQEAVEFAEWILDSTYMYHKSWEVWTSWHTGKMTKATTTELYQLFLTSKSK